MSRADGPVGAAPPPALDSAYPTSASPVRALLRPALIVLVSACDAAPTPAEAPTAARIVADNGEDGRPSWHLGVNLRGGGALSQDAAGLTLDGAPLVDDPAGPFVVDAAGARFVVAARVNGGPDTALLACAPPAPCRTVTDAGHPDRATISADGRLIAWVAAADGLPAVFAARFDGGPAVQLTNRDLRWTAGQPPDGFVPPPHEGPLAFTDDGRALVWTSPEGDHHAVLPW